MLSKVFGQFHDSISSPSKTQLLFLSSALLALSSCSNISVQPKDPELIAMENFAKGVTTHLFEQNPSTYEEYQKSLAKEISPSLLDKLKKRNMYANSKDQIQKNIKSMVDGKKRVLVSIESASFPDTPTKKGLIPIEVQGTCIKSANDVSKSSKLDILYSVGTSEETKGPMIASIQIKAI